MSSIYEVRREAKLLERENFTVQEGQTTFQLLRQNPPLSVFKIFKNGSPIESGWTFDGNRTVTYSSVTTGDEILIVIGTHAEDEEVDDMIDFAYHEVFSFLSRCYTNPTSSPYFHWLVEKLAAGYLILKYHEGKEYHFNEYGRQLVDLVKKQLKRLCTGEMHLYDEDGAELDRTSVNLTVDYIEQVDMTEDAYPYDIYDYGDSI